MQKIAASRAGLSRARALSARWMDPQTGTFLSVDPVVSDYTDPQTLNAYSYARNNPISFNDPTGGAANPVPGDIPWKIDEMVVKGSPQWDSSGPGGIPWTAYQDGTFMDALGSKFRAGEAHKVRAKLEGIGAGIGPGAEEVDEMVVVGNSRAQEAPSAGYTVLPEDWARLNEITGELLASKLLEEALVAAISAGEAKIRSLRRSLAEPPDLLPNWYDPLLKDPRQRVPQGWVDGYRIAKLPQWLQDELRRTQIEVSRLRVELHWERVHQQNLRAERHLLRSR